MKYITIPKTIKETYSCGDINCNACEHHRDCIYYHQSMKEYKRKKDNKFWRNLK